MKLADSQIEAFRQVLYRYYDAHGRHDLPWRQASDGVFDPYHIVVSELMLQQTQVGRVIPKFERFLQQFPDFTSLAKASLGEVLVQWQGLGYNRRAKFLWQLAGQVVEEHDATLPQDVAKLVQLPGIGKNTAGAICAYAWNKPEVFIETNVRTVYFHHFFADRHDIADHEVASLVARTIDEQQPRLFYWAVMDYGTYLKGVAAPTIHRSKHYTKQSKFEGSRRQVRGQIIRCLTDGPATLAMLLEQVEDERTPEVINDLLREGMVAKQGKSFRLA